MGIYEMINMRLLNCLLVTLVSLAFIEVSHANETKVIDNASALNELLVNKNPLVSIKPIAAQRGCGPEVCSIDIDGLSILRDQGGLLESSRKNKIEIKPQTSGELPEIDWDPLGGFAVSRNGKRWGTCLEFTHSGLGKSGSLQRWSSVILVPWADSHPSLIAFRFVGYWAGCDVLMEGVEENEVNLPVIEHVNANKDKSLHILSYTCSALGCKTNEDTRKVREDADSESGALIIEQRSNK